MAARPEFRLALLLVLFYAGWIKFLADGTDVYLIDYAQRVLIVALGWAALSDGFRQPLPPITDRVWLWAIAGAAAIIAADTWTGGLAQRAAFDTALFPEAGFPPLENEVWQAVDLTFGLVLVAVSEELVFRRLWADWWDARGGGVAGLYVGSALVFGLLHLPQGLADTAIACVWGVLLMYLYRRSRSLALVVLIHFLVDLWYFT
ncbi:MAG: CPBP family intramembrane glutamic endopeptidase [Rhodospirillales bacterium]